MKNHSMDKTVKCYSLETYIINQTVTTDQEQDQFKFECQKEILVRNQNQLILAHMHFQRIKFS